MLTASVQPFCRTRSSSKKFQQDLQKPSKPPELAENGRPPDSQQVFPLLDQFYFGMKRIQVEREETSYMCATDCHKAYRGKIQLDPLLQKLL